MISYLGTQILGGVKKLEKRQFIIITDKYLIVGKYPRIPNIYLYSLITVSVLWPGDIKYGPKDMAKVMEALDKHKKYAIPLEDIDLIDITMPKTGFFTIRTKKGYIIIRLKNGQSIKVVGEYECSFDNVVKLFNKLFPNKVRVFKQ